jgi:hypothetical protein
MAIDDELRKIAGEIAAEAQGRVTQLEQQTLELKKRLAETKAKRDAARLAPERLANYPVKLGPNYQCPRCWIDHEHRAPLRPVPNDNAREDILRCGRCGADWPIPVF